MFLKGIWGLIGGVRGPLCCCHRHQYRWQGDRLIGNGRNSTSSLDFTPRSRNLKRKKKALDLRALPLSPSAALRAPLVFVQTQGSLRRAQDSPGGAPTAGS